MFTSYAVIVEKFAERHYISKFKKKYKNAWEITWGAVEEQFKEQFKETTLSRDQIVFLFYLQRNLGVLSNACKAYNISRTAIYKWKKKSVEFAQAFDEVTEYTTDKVEASLLEQILKDKNTQATIFYLKSK